MRNRYIGRMECPKCGFVQFGNAVDCPRCGVVFAKLLRPRHEAAAPLPIESAERVQKDLERLHTERAALTQELRARAVALPGALLVAWISVKGSPGLVRIFTMWVHETGHAVSAWLCGYTAWPGPWITPIGGQRSILLAGLLMAMLVFGAV